MKKINVKYLNYFIMEDLFIPLDFIRSKELSTTECFVLAIYRHYTFKCDEHCCTLPNKEVCKIPRIGERQLKRIKKHLKELGYIRTDGMKVVYVKEMFDDDGSEAWFCED